MRPRINSLRSLKTELAGPCEPRQRRRRGVGENRRSERAGDNPADRESADALVEQRQRDLAAIGNLIDGAAEHVPPAIVAQVADGGEIALAILEEGVSRLAIGRVVAGAFGLSIFADAEAASVPGFEKPRGFSF